MRSSTTRMYGAFTLARNSASSPKLQFVKPCTSAFGWSKQESDQTLVRFLLDGAPIHGAFTEIRVSPVAVAGDDAAADAGDQAAATVESRSGGLCRGRVGAQSAARARQ